MGGRVLNGTEERTYVGCGNIKRGANHRHETEKLLLVPDIH